MGRVSIIGIRAVSAPLAEDRRVGLVVSWTIAALRKNLAHSQYISNPALSLGMTSSDVEDPLDHRGPVFRPSGQDLEVFQDLDFAAAVRVSAQDE